MRISSCREALERISFAPCQRIRFMKRHPSASERGGFFVR